MAFREKMEWTMHMGLLVFILAAAAFLSAITTIRIAIRSRQVQLPNLVGQNLTSAQDEAASARHRTESRGPNLRRASGRNCRTAKSCRWNAGEDFAVRPCCREPGFGENEHTSD